LFEIARHYRLNLAPNGGEVRPVETRVLTLGATGEAREKGLYDSARDFSFADLKGDLDAIGALAGGLGWSEGGPEWLHAAKRGRVRLGEGELGAAGQLARRVAERLKLRQDVFLAELALGPLYCMYYGLKNARRYAPIPRFPEVERDFSLLLGEGATFDEVRKTIQSIGIPEITSIEAADLFRGRNVPAGKYSLLVRVRFQSRETTLTDAQIADYSAKVVTALERNLGAQLRAS
jgi:phenylalanyl-tRNA synthetase beta chain